jgi:G3E family GTPase
MKDPIGNRSKVYCLATRAEDMAEKKIPVTVLTGFLGSGKTTLLNHILTANHGRRIAVIENEFGEVGIDQELVVRAEEEIFEMNNGCICCTVRGDLIRILGNLIKRREAFDHILIETTGMADPGPVAQTFFVDEEMQRHLSLDGIVTIVDAKHVWEHLDSSEEVREQIAFADCILINKIDLATPLQIEELQSRIKKMNGVAKQYLTQDSVIDMDCILGLGGFNIQRALEVDPKFLEPEYPFEWGGVFEIATQRFSIECQEGPDPSMRILLLPCPTEAASELEGVLRDAVIHFSDDAREVPSGGEIRGGGEALELVFNPNGASSYDVLLSTPGRYALFTEHQPNEFDLVIRADGQVCHPLQERLFKPDHEHDDEISSVGLEFEQDMDAEKVQLWLSELLRIKGNDIFRMKGVFAVAGEDRRLALQGVHMLLKAERLDSWGARSRRSTLVFIGRNLDREALKAGIEECISCE